MDFLEDINLEDIKLFDAFFNDFYDYTQTLDCPDDPLDKVVEDFPSFANKPISSNDLGLTHDLLETFSFGDYDDDETKTDFITLCHCTTEQHKEEQYKEEQLQFRSFFHKKRRSNRRRKEKPISKRRCCSHCQSEKTPQWRAGPLGPKSLCNACGVRYKSGRLLPEYRPAASPNFDRLKHSNFHKKIMKRKMCCSKDT